MSSLKPYLIRAIYEWIVDNRFTPYLLVDATHVGAVLPTDFIEEGRIVLNIRPEAIQNLVLGNDAVTFNARFSGKAMHIVAPLGAILALYAKENGRGMVFDPEDTDAEDTPPTTPAPKKPSLRVVK